MPRTISRPQAEALRTAAPITEWQDLPDTHPLARLKARRAITARRSTVDVLKRLGLAEDAEAGTNETTGRPWTVVTALTPAGEALAATLEEGGPLPTLDAVATAVAAHTAPAAADQPATPGDVVRPGVTIRRDGRSQWTVERDGHMGVIHDEKGMTRGRWAAWSPFARTRHGIVAFTSDPAEAVDAILVSLPVLISTLAAASGRTVADILNEASTLAAEWADQGPRAVFRSMVVDGEALLNGPAVLVILDALATRATETPAEEPAPVPAEPEWRTLKGLAAPFYLWGAEGERGWRPAGDRKQCTGTPLRIERTWMRAGIRYAEDATGRELYLWGAAAKHWAAPAA
ncbi:hypothetical protein ACFWC2_14435 [Streptomyces diastaticus]|uniref:hypothetical protein n=1 Tax=Streptomyces diastaticus TaxID=1956 RepID=UPI00366853C0